MERFQGVLGKGQRVFLGAIDVSTTQVEEASRVSDLAIKATNLIGLEHIGLTTNCGFSPFGDDLTMPREIAFSKLSALGAGALQASVALGL